MKTPVLIAARNEAARITRTLDALPREAEPIVIPNGCQDDTARIARQYNVTVLDGAAEGKMPALQLGLSYLGERAVEPFITLDADSFPILPKRWLPKMLNTRQTMDPDKPAMVVGPYFFNGPDIITAAWRNAGHWRQFFQTRNDQRHGAAGCNMLFDPKTVANVEKLLALPNIWPREDAAMRDVLLDDGAELTKLVHPHALVATSGDRFPGLKTRIALGRAVSGELVRQSYLQEAAPHSIPYWELPSSTA